MSTFKGLIEDLIGLISLSAPGAVVTIGTDPDYIRLRELLELVKDSPDLDMLSPEELRALTTFKITVFRAEKMEPTMARKHIGAVWRGAAKQALLKLPIGPEAETAVHALMAGGIG